MTLLLDDREPGFAAAFAALVEARREETADVRDVVSAIIADVRRDGDQALIDYTRRFDRVPDRGRAAAHPVSDRSRPT